MTTINISELSLDNIGAWPQVIKLITIVIVASSLMGLSYWFIMRHQLERLNTLHSEELTLREEFESKQHSAANLQAYKQQLGLMQQRFGVLLRQLPSKTEVPGLLEDISKTGVRSGLHFHLFDPLQEIEHDFYVELPIKIMVEGNYHQLAIFISRIARLSRIVTLHDFIIEPGKKGRNVSNPKLLMMKITAKIYRYQEANEVMENGQ